MNLLNSYTALRTGCTPGKTLNCLAHSMHVSALRSRRSLRSLARCARLAMLNVLNHLKQICAVSRLHKPPKIALRNPQDTSQDKVQHRPILGSFKTRKQWKTSNQEHLANKNIFLAAAPRVLDA